MNPHTRYIYQFVHKKKADHDSAVSHGESWPDRYKCRDITKINSSTDVYELRLDGPFPVDIIISSGSRHRLNSNYPRFSPRSRISRNTYAYIIN